MYLSVYAGTAAVIAYINVWEAVSLEQVQSVAQNI